jgi:hypothetical protein
MKGSRLAAEHTPRLRPLGMSDVLDELFAVYRRGFKTFVGTTALVQVPSTIVSLPFLTATSTFTDRLTEGSDPSAAFAVFEGIAAVSLGLTVIVAIVGQILLLAATCYVTSAIYLGETPSVGEAYRPAFKHFWGLFRLGVIVFVLFMGGLLLAVAPLAVPALICLSAIIMLLEFAALVYFSTRWSLAIPALVLEGLTSAVGALRRSQALVEGAWWRTFVTLVVMTLLVGIIQVIAAGLVEALTAGVQALALPGTINRPAWLGVLSALLQTVAGVLYGPLFYIGVTLLYYDRRIRAEAYDLSVMARELAEPRPLDGE